MLRAAAVRYGLTQDGLITPGFPARSMEVISGCLSVLPVTR